MKIEKIDHIGIAVKDLDSASRLYNEVFHLEIEKIEEFKDLNLKIAFISVGGVMVELVQPTSPDAPLAKRIREQGEGLYHLALRVDNIDEALQELKKKGIEMRDNEPRAGGMGSRIAFLKPNSMNNVIIELVERRKEI